MTERRLWLTPGLVEGVYPQRRTDVAGQQWTDEDKRNFYEWVDSGIYGPPREPRESSPLWIDALIICGVFAFCAAFWTGLVWLLFFR